MILLGLGKEKESFQILTSEKNNTGIEYFYPNNGLEHLKIIDRLIVKKYVALLNKIQVVNKEDSFYFVDEQATAIELLIEIYNKPIFGYKTKTIECIKEEINNLNNKYNKYKKNGITEFERIRVNRDKNKANYDFYEDSDSNNIHYEIVKTLTNIYTINHNKKED